MDTKKGIRPDGHRLWCPDASVRMEHEQGAEDGFARYVGYSRCRTLVLLDYSALLAGRGARDLRGPKTEVKSRCSVSVT